MLLMLPIEISDNAVTSQIVTKKIWRRAGNWQEHRPLEGMWVRRYRQPQQQLSNSWANVGAKRCFSAEMSFSAPLAGISGPSFFASNCWGFQRLLFLGHLSLIRNKSQTPLFVFYCWGFVHVERNERLGALSWRYSSHSRAWSEKVRHFCRALACSSRKTIYSGQRWWNRNNHNRSKWRGTGGRKPGSNGGGKCMGGGGREGGRWDTQRGGSWEK